VRFFGRRLRDRPGALDGTAPVKVFVMGIDQWRGADPAQGLKRRLPALRPQHRARAASSPANGTCG